MEKGNLIIALAVKLKGVQLNIQNKILEIYTA